MWAHILVLSEKCAQKRHISIFRPVKIPTGGKIQNLAPAAKLKLLTPEQYHYTQNDPDVSVVFINNLCCYARSLREYSKS